MLHRRHAIVVFAALLGAGLATSSCKKSSSTKSVGPPLPGAEVFSAELAGELAAALNKKGAEYQARTVHKGADGTPRYTNRLIKEASPYLLQHAHNPVNWYPWGDEAFEAAKRLGRPVFLSIGYATCHWCHVMEEESFEDIEIATFINANYIAIKVDREERPDVDSVYMSALQAMGQNGGWPLNMWLTPERLPFFGGTYFPPRKGVRRARIGFDEILARAADQFVNNGAELAQQAAQVAEAIGRANEAHEVTASFDGAGLVARTAGAYLTKVDRGFGGLLGQRSKFPSAFPIRTMLRYAAGEKEPAKRAETDKLIALTLDAMRNGGIYDQVGGGFHRYSVDPRWMIPHFEKMLYDNALLVVTYLEAYQAFGRDDYAAVASDVLAYLVREMRAPDGGFYSATDADSMTADGHREEGAYFVWQPAELATALSADDAALATEVWGVSSAGNFEGKNNLHVAVAGIDRNPRLLAIRDTLLAERGKREPPLLDDKILAAWNGLMLSALSRAAAVLPPGYQPPPPARGAGLDFKALAIENASFIVEKLLVSGRLRRAYKDGTAYGTAYAEDYAFVIAGLIGLFEAVGDPRWLEHALALQKTLDGHYRTKGGAYYTTADDAERLLTREIPARDGALPSANSVAALNLLRFYELTSEPRFLDDAEKLLASFASKLQKTPQALSEMLLAVDFRERSAKEIVLAGTAEDGFGGLDDVLRKTFLPNAVVVRKASGAPKELGKVVPLSANKSPIGARPTAFVCEQSRCELPTRDPAAFSRQLSKAVSP